MTFKAIIPLKDMYQREFTANSLCTILDKIDDYLNEYEDSWKAVYLYEEDHLCFVKYPTPAGSFWISFLTGEYHVL